jgi:uncharacterized protein YceK
MRKKTVCFFQIVMIIVLTSTWITWMSGCSVISKTDMSKYSKYKYIGSKSSGKFHTRSCFLGKRITLSDAVFFNSASNAKRAKYKACSICQP